MEKIQAGNLSDDLLDVAEKRIFELMRHSIIPLWKGSLLFRAVMKQANVKTLEEYRQGKKAASKDEHLSIQMEVS